MGRAQPSGNRATSGTTPGSGTVELIGSSSESWEEAARNAVGEASRSYQDLRVAEVVETDVLIEDGDVIAYRTKVRPSYERATG